MDKGYAIFDMDGTLVDSMGYWDRLAAEYLHSKGVKQVPPEVLEQIKPMTMAESGELFRREFGFTGTAEEIAEEMNAMMEDHYRLDVPLKPGVRAYLASLRDRGTVMCVASATAEWLMEMCLKRLGVLDMFRFVLSCDSVGRGKDSPAVYDEAARRLGAPSPGEVAVYEDAIYAARTAKNAGYYLVGVYDPSGAAYWEQIKDLADETLVGWKEE